MKAVWGLLCQASVIDRDTNNVSMFNIIEHIIVPSEPPDWAVREGEANELLVNAEVVAAGLFELVVLLERDDFNTPEKGESKVTVHPPGSGRHLVEARAIVDLERHLRTRIRLKLAGLPFAKEQIFEGTYRFLVHKKVDDNNWEEIHEVRIGITVDGPPTITTPEDDL